MLLQDCMKRSELEEKIKQLAEHTKTIFRYIYDNEKAWSQQGDNLYIAFSLREDYVPVALGPTTIAAIKDIEMRVGKFPIIWPVNGAEMVYPMRDT